MEIRIKLKIKGVEIELDLKEAKELKEILEGITGNKTEIIKEKEYVPYYPYRYPYYPEPYNPWTVTWTSDASSTISGGVDYTIAYNIQNK